MLELPTDVLTLIFSYLDFPEVFSLTRVSTRFASALKAPHLWKVWWTQHLWLRKEPQFSTVIAGSGEERDWKTCCKLRSQCEYEQLDATTDICWVALQGNAKAIRKLVDLGVSVHFVRGKTPLHCAAERGHLRAIKVLVELGADVNASRDVTPLHLAARYGRNHAIAQLVALGARIDVESANRSKPIHFAVHAGVETVRILVQLGADVNARNAHEDTPLHEAAESSSMQVAQALVEQGADVNARNAAGSTPLHNAAERPEGIVRVLLRMGARVDAPDNLGVTPYHLAMWRGHTENAGELVRMGAKMDKPPAGAIFMRCMRSPAT